MAVTMNARWDDSGTVIPGGTAEYVVAEQPIAEYDNWFNYNIVADIQAVIDDVINKFNANTILKADTDNTPAALVVAEQTIVGRKTGNSIAALTASEVRTILNVEDGAAADQTNNQIRDAVEAAADSNTFTDNDHTKLNGIESGADVTDSTNVAAAGAVMDSDFSPAEGFMRKTGAGAYTTVKSNMSAVVAPTVDDDSGDGYVVGSKWINTTTSSEYVCIDNTIGAASWGIVSGHLINSIESKLVFTTFASGTDIFHSHDAVASTASASYIKVKTITLGVLPSDSLIVYFEIKSAYAAQPAYGRVYRNGGAVGTERTNTTASYSSFTETISGWSIDDTLELWIYDAGGNADAYCRNFRILAAGDGIKNS